MWLWWLMLVCDLLIPLVMIAAGWMMWKRCPKKINMVLGYRTTRSMRNMDTWKFAHEYCGRLWWRIGWIMLVLSAAIFIPLYHSGEAAIETVGMGLMILQCVVLILPVFPTEAALKKTFYEDGRRR